MYVVWRWRWGVGGYRGSFYILGVIGSYLCNFLEVMRIKLFLGIFFLR